MAVGEPVVGAVTVHGRVADAAERYRDRPAISAPEGRWTYDELSRRVAAVAEAVRGIGAGPGDRIGHLFELDPDAIASGVGTLAAGAVWVPLDPAWPDERLATVLADADPTGILCADGLAERARRLAGERPVTTASDAFATRTEKVPTGSAAGDTAMLLFTSGSTGVPKGVAIGHRGLLFNTDAHRRALQIDERDRVAMTVRPSYLAGITSLFRALFSGAAVALRDGRRLGVVGLADWLRDEAITVLQTTPTVFRQLAASAGDAPFPALRWMHLGGERATTRDLERFAALPMPGARLLHNYGSTETGTICQLVLARGERCEGSEVPVGHPFEGRRVRLVDATGAEVAQGEVGEIVVESRRLLALEYWRRPEESERSFVAVDEADPELRAFRTGDLGRLDDGGRLIHLGRADGQVQLAGQRVETGEVECRLVDHPSVLEAAVTTRTRDGGEVQLVAHVVLRPDSDLDPAGLRRHLLERLPTHMVPTQWRSWPALPRTSTGKTDRQGLALEDAAQASGPGAAISSTDAIGEELARIWCRLLERDTVRPADDFFALGGTSLVAIELCLEIRSRLALEVEPSVLYAHPTLEELAHRLRSEDSQAASVALHFHRDGARPFVACVPGNLTSPRVGLAGLLEGLGVDQPLIAFQDRPDLPTDVDAVADRYLEEMQRARPEGPVALIGICWGAAVAFAMAQRLRERDREVRLLALVEPTRLFPPGWLSVARAVLPSYLGRLVRRGGAYRAELSELGRGGRRLYLRQKGKMFRNSVALRRWRPRPAEGSADVYLTAGSLASRQVDRMIWRDLFAMPPAVHALPGVHEDLTGTDGAPVDHELLADLGRRLRSRLDALAARPR